MNDEAEERVEVNEFEDQFSVNGSSVECRVSRVESRESRVES